MEAEDVRSPDYDPEPPARCQECHEDDFSVEQLPPAPEMETNRNRVFAFHQCTSCGARYNDRSHRLTQAASGEQISWEEVFGHPEPYPHQREAIKKTINTLDSGGYTAVEGGCGTGKTMISLTAGLTLVRDPRYKYERIMVLTSVKQQLRQFEDDLRIINENLPENIGKAKSVTLVGKGDLCPYAREEDGALSLESIATDCRTLRNSTSSLSTGKHSVSGERLAQTASEAEQSRDGSWESEGAVAPYPPAPMEREEAYCPFYARYKAHEDPLFTFGHEEQQVLTPEALVEHGVNNGVCPHSAMATLAHDADVIIANYYHAFDADTTQLTQGIIDDTTLLVCDEAHMLEPRVRDILSRGETMYGLYRARRELERVCRERAVRTGASVEPVEVHLDSDTVREELGKAAIPDGSLSDIGQILMGIEELLRDCVGAYLNKNHSGWDGDFRTAPEEVTVPLRDPTEVEHDVLTKWAQGQGIADHVWTMLSKLGPVVDDILSVGVEGSYGQASFPKVASLFYNWFERGNDRYYRQVELEKRDEPLDMLPGWQKWYRATVELHCSMPQVEIGNRLLGFGGGILMSATLEPLDVYREVTGLEYISYQHEVPISEQRYHAGFPRDRRDSIILPLPPFVYDNRGDPSEQTETRRQYGRAITVFTRNVSGNALICMPSYGEAEWAYHLLNQSDSVSKPVLLDQSSSEEETRALKREFFNGRGKVLVTSLRGTLTEGVDFDGDKLRGAFVAGVPIESVGNPSTQALRTAYEGQFGKKMGFDFGLTVPAVRKTRQAVGRVIRGKEDVGVRVLADERYAGRGQNPVGRYLSDREQEEFEVVEDIGAFERRLQDFWREVS